MKKSELIAKLNEIPDDPLVLIDVDGCFSSDVSPVCYKADQRMLDSVDTLSPERPALGDPVILI